MEMVKNHENPGKGLQGGMRRYGGGRKSMKEDKNRDCHNKMKHYENSKFNAKEKVYDEKKRKGPKAKLKRWRN